MTPSAHGATPRGPDPRVQRITANLFRRMLGGGPAGIANYLGRLNKLGRMHTSFGLESSVQSRPKGLNKFSVPFGRFALGVTPKGEPTLASTVSWNQPL